MTPYNLNLDRENDRRIGGTCMWSYLDCQRYGDLSEQGTVELERARQAARERGLRLITHDLTNSYTDDFGNLKFDQLVITDWDTGEAIAKYNESEVGQANDDYCTNGFWHAECYMP